MSRNKGKPRPADGPASAPVPRADDGTSSDRGEESFAAFARSSGGIEPLDPSPRKPPPRANTAGPIAPTHKRSSQDPSKQQRAPKRKPREATANERRRLRSGTLQPTVRIDLHGLNRRQARGRLEHALVRARALDARCVLVIHGKGSHSDAGTPVLKLALFEWIAEAPLEAIVRATAPASPRDGGAGATYLLLYR